MVENAPAGLAARSARIVGASGALALVCAGVLYARIRTDGPLAGWKPGAFGGAILWAVAILGAASALFWISRWREERRALAAMLRPVVVLALAAAVLFLSDQGSELGVSLMISNGFNPQFFYLFLALSYWAVNGWLSARLGLDRALDAGELGVLPDFALKLKDASAREKHWRVAPQDTPWVFWPPRVIGVGAHFLAACNLSLAAWRQPEFHPEILRWVVPLAPIFVLVVTWLVWAFDDRAISERTASAPLLKSRDDRRAAGAPRDATAAPRLRDRRQDIGLRYMAAAIALLAVVGAAAVFTHRLPSGFLPGTFAIGVSAVVFLATVSILRRKAPLPRDAREHDELGPDGSVIAPGLVEEREREKAFLAGSSLVVAALNLPLVVWVWRDAVSFGDVFGSMVIVFFAFGALLATLNLFDLATTLLADPAELLALRLLRLPERGADLERRRAYWAKRLWWYPWKKNPLSFRKYGVLFIVVFCVVNAWLTPFHEVRSCALPEACTKLAGAAFEAPSGRPGVEDAAKVWYDQALAQYRRFFDGGAIPKDARMPMLIVSTAGGGIRAAYWTAHVLEKLAQDSDFAGTRPFLFAISGVSGGSVGASAFAAALAERDAGRCPGAPPKCPRATEFLTRDFLAPVVASWIFKDTLASLYWGATEDRGAALERAFEAGSDGLLKRPFLSLSPFAGSGQTPQIPWRPILLLNATHEETGRRVVAGHVKIERHVFIDALDELELMKSDVPASTAAHNSARFFYVSPAGALPDRKGSVIDGGYFENFGAVTALEIGRAAEHALENHGPVNVKLVILSITSNPTLVRDPDLDEHNYMVRIDQAGDRPCVVRATERSQGQPKGSNYLTVDGDDVANAWVNEFLAPFRGLYQTREAHGNRAASELALTVCEEVDRIQTQAKTTASAPAPGEKPANATSTAAAAGQAATQGANVVRQNGAPSAARKDAATPPEDGEITEVRPAEGKLELPYFAQVAMCEADNGKAVKVRPPLGWVISSATAQGLDGLDGSCGNAGQFNELRKALRPDVANTLATSPAKSPAKPAGGSSP